MSSGEEKARGILKDLNPAEVCRNAIAEYDEATGIYLLKSFGMDLSVDPEKRIEKERYWRRLFSECFH
jgi:hypothetical protein